MNGVRRSLLHLPEDPEGRDAWFMAMALEEAAAAAEREEVPVGAVLVGEEGVLARCGNRCLELKDPTAHAEMLAITTACAARGEGRLPGTTLYCTLEPCFMCAGALLHARVARIVFAARDPKFGACASLARLPEDRRLNHRCLVEEGLHADLSAAMLREFFKDRR